MNRLLLGSLAAVLVSSYACAGRSPTPALYGETPGRLVFWSVHGEDSELLGYLLGSIHLDRLEARGFDKAIENAFEASESLVIELSPASLTSGEVRDASADAPPLDHGLSRDQLEEVRAAADAIFLDLTRLNDAPFWLARQILASAIFDHAGYTSDRGFEWHFIRRAAVLGTPVLELETAQEQIAALSAGSVEEQRQAFLALARDRALAAQELGALHRAYARGDLETLEALLRPTPKTSAEAMMLDALFGERDARLAERSAQLYAEPGLDFIVVGAGHLVGSANLRRRLVEYGFSLRRVEAMGTSKVARLPLAALPAAPEAPLPVATIDFPPDLEQRTEEMGGNRSMQLIADVAGFRYVYTVSALNRPVFLERLFGRIERGVAAGGRFERIESRDETVGGATGRLHRFESNEHTLLGAIAYRDGFVHTFAVVGTSNRTVELEERFEALRASFVVAPPASH